MKYCEELKVHPDGDLEENKVKQVRQPGLLYRTDHKMDMYPPVEYANNRWKLQASNEKFKKCISSDETNVERKNFDVEESVYGILDVSEQRQLSLHLSLLEQQPSEHEEPLDPSRWAGPSWVEARGSQGPVSEVNKIIAHQEEICKTHVFSRATGKYQNELEVHRKDDRWIF